MNIKMLQDKFQSLLTITCLEHAQKMSRSFEYVVDHDLTSWEELGFTKEDLDRQVRGVAARDIINRFPGFLSSVSIDDADAFSVHVKEYVLHRTISWDDLGFTEKQLNERVRRVKLRYCKMLYPKFFRTCTDPDSAERECLIIKSLVSQGVTTWKELKFTDNQLDDRVRGVFVRYCKKLYSETLLGGGILRRKWGHFQRMDLRATRNIGDDIKRRVASRAISWRELGFNRKQLDTAVVERTEMGTIFGSSGNGRKKRSR